MLAQFSAQREGLLKLNDLTNNYMQNDPLLLFNHVLLAILLFFGILYLGQPFLVPIAIGALFAILMISVCVRLEKWGLGRSIASLICVLLLLILFSALSYFMTGQITGFVRDPPAIKTNLNIKLDNIHLYVDDTFGMPRSEQKEVLDGQVNSLFQQMGSYFTLLVYNMGSFIMDFFIVSLYCYFFLRYRHRFKTLLIQLITRRMERKTDDIFPKISTVGNGYITGVALVVLILAICNTIALSIIGLQQALFFGVLAGMLNIIPFIGSMVGSAIPILVLLLTRESYGAPLLPPFTS